MMITTLVAAVLTAAQPVNAAPATQSSPAMHTMPHQPGEMHHEHGDMGKMSAEDCAKCCEEMMAKMHEGHDSAVTTHKHQ